MKNDKEVIKLDTQSTNPPVSKLGIFGSGTKFTKIAQAPNYREIQGLDAAFAAAQARDDIGNHQPWTDHHRALAEIVLGKNGQPNPDSRPQPR